MMKSSKLKKLSMPEDSKKPDLAELELDEQVSEASEAEPEMAADELESMELEESNPALEQLSDDELLAEIKKRGLMSDLEAPSEEQPEA